MFINHRGLDGGSAAAWLTRELRAHGLRVFLDESGGPQAGDDWPTELRQAARSCRLFIAIISPCYYQAVWPARELAIALERLQQQRQPGAAALTVIPVYSGWTRQQAHDAVREAARGSIFTYSGAQGQLITPQPQYSLPDAAKEQMQGLSDLQPPNAERIYYEHYKLREVEVAEEIVRAALRVLPRDFKVPAGELLLLACQTLHRPARTVPA